MKWLGKYNLNYSGEYISLSTNKTLPIDHFILSSYGEEPAPPGLRSLSCGVWLVMDVLYVEAGVSAGWWLGGGSTKTVHCRHEAVLRTASPGHVTLTTTHHHHHHHTHTTRNTNPHTQCWPGPSPSPPVTHRPESHDGERTSASGPGDWLAVVIGGVHRVQSRHVQQPRERNGTLWAMKDLTWDPCNEEQRIGWDLILRLKSSHGTVCRILLESHSGNISLLSPNNFIHS